VTPVGVSGLASTFGIGAPTGRPPAAVPVGRQSPAVVG
jgi:hypothetical protein